KITSGGACRRSSAMAAGTKSRSRFSQRWPVLSGNLLHSVEGGEGFGIRQIVKDGDRAYRSGAGRARARLRSTGEASNLSGCDSTEGNRLFRDNLHSLLAIIGEGHA